MWHAACGDWHMHVHPAHLRRNANVLRDCYRAPPAPPAPAAPAAPPLTCLPTFDIAHAFCIFAHHFGLYKGPSVQALSRVLCATEEIAVRV